MHGVTVLVLVGVALVLTGCEKYALDRQMDELCKKDGGVQIFENIKLPIDRFDENGQIKPIYPPKSEEDRLKHIYGKDYIYTSSTKIIKNGDPVAGEGLLRRFENKLIRASDGKVMGVSVQYARSGGDFIAYAHPSSKLCPHNGINNSIESVFTKE